MKALDKLQRVNFLTFPEVVGGIKPRYPVGLPPLARGVFSVAVLRYDGSYEFVRGYNPTVHLDVWHPAGNSEEEALEVVNDRAQDILNEVERSKGGHAKGVYALSGDPSCWYCSLVVFYVPSETSRW